MNNKKLLQLPLVASSRLLPISVNPSDIWFTPEWVAKDVVSFFQPSGRILDPCKGEGAFLRQMQGAEWCEIREGRDFFDWNEHVDWIISNPPNSVWTEWFQHSIEIADNIVYLIPIHKIFGSWERLTSLKGWGWIKHIRFHGQSRVYGYNVGYACGAVYFKKGHKDETTFSFYG